MELKEMLSSRDALGAYRECDTLGAYHALLRLLPTSRRDRIVWEAMAVYRILGFAIQRLLDRIIVDSGKTPGLPPPLELIDHLESLGMGVQDYYNPLLSSLLVRNAPMDEALIVFTAAVRCRIAAAENPADIQREDVETLFDGQRMLYIVYLHLDDRSASSPILSAIDLHIHFCTVPSPVSIASTLRAISGLPPAEFERLRELPGAFRLRHLLRSPLRLKNLLERFTENNDLVGLQKTYASARLQAPLMECVYRVFITAYLSFWRSQQGALVVWEDMVQDGIQPSASSWNALLRYGRSHDRSALLVLWQRMIKVGIVPDVHCWTTRIHSQLTADMVAEGLDSLSQMVASGTQPTTETINAVVDGLLKHDHFDEVQRVIQFAESIGVSADLVTYNTLMRGILRRGGNIQEVMHMLRVIQSRDLTPDVYTFTTALDGLFTRPRTFYRYPPDSPPDPPTEADILTIFNYMESIGIRANITTYTALVEGLLKTYNFTAVAAVREIMRLRGIAGNVEFYTVLLKDAMRRADLELVDKLWAEMWLRKVRRDHVIWTELLLGLAHLGTTVRLVSALKAMKEESRRKVITLKGYVSILRALERHGEVMVAKKIIEDVTADWDARQEARKEGSAGRIEEEFWEVVSKLGGRGWMTSLREGVYMREDAPGSSRRLGM